jgi:hypothetical protein
MKQFLAIALLFFATFATAQKGKGQGTMATVTVDLSDANGNYANITLIDLTTGTQYETDASGAIEVPKHGEYQVWLHMYNGESSEVNYWIDVNGSPLVGITLQPGDFRGVANGAMNPISFKKDGTVTLRRM